MFLPDISMVHGRIIVAAWEFGLEDVDDDAVHLLMRAIEVSKYLYSSILNQFIQNRVV